MTFLDPWTSAYEGIPADTENINLGANRIRDLKVNVRERANVDHSWGDVADNGQHNKVSFNVSSADPATSGQTSFLYTKTVSGISELFWEDSAGHVDQLTAAGAINFQSFPSGTVLSFLQASPPTGWSVNASFNDQIIRLVSGAGGGTTGGSWTISGTSVATTLGSLAAASSSPGTVSGTVASHTLVVGEIPSHTHNVTVNATNVNSANGGGGTSVPVAGSGSYTT